MTNTRIYFLITTLLAFTFLFQYCTEPVTDTNVYSAKYEVGKIRGLDSFKTYNQYEKKFDSIDAQYPTVEKGKFMTNRSRIYMESFENGKPASQEKALYTGAPMPCECVFSRDTIYISSIVGFFGGSGHGIKIFKDSFESFYVNYTDDVKPFKYNLTDTSFTDNLAVMSKYQTLRLEEKPAFKIGQQLTGLLTFTSRDYYAQSIGDMMDTQYVKGKMFFTCQVK